MKNSIAYRKGIVLMLATVCWVFGLQGIGYSQVDMTTVQISSGEQIYAKAIRSVMWIITDDAQASAVLIDKSVNSPSPTNMLRKSCICTGGFSGS